eukprot:gene19356-54789_t
MTGLKTGCGAPPLVVGMGVWPMPATTLPAGAYLSRPLVGPTVADEGIELAGSTDAHLDGCKRMCDQTGGCRSFSYRPSARDCWLKDRCIAQSQPDARKLQWETDWVTYYQPGCTVAAVPPVSKVVLTLRATDEALRLRLEAIYASLLRLLLRRLPWLRRSDLTIAGGVAGHPDDTGLPPTPPPPVGATDAAVAAEERRDPGDGVWKTEEEFKDEYGEPDYQPIWDEAARDGDPTEDLPGPFPRGDGPCGRVSQYECERTVKGAPCVWVDSHRYGSRWGTAGHESAFHS